MHKIYYKGAKVAAIAECMFWGREYVVDALTTDSIQIWFRVKTLLRWNFVSRIESFARLALLDLQLKHQYRQTVQKKYF